MKRYSHDLGHQVHTCGKIGALQTLSTIPVIAGDSFSVKLDALFRLAPLRRNLTMDCKIDLFAFYIPYRHIYGDKWTDFIKQGVDETINFQGYILSNDAFYLGGHYNAGTIIPMWLVAGYNRIWNRYFRVPTDDASIHDDSAAEPTLDNRNQVGRPCAYLKTIWSTGIYGETDADDREVSTAGNKLDIIDLEQVKMRYKTETQREWFGQRYNDVLKNTWGSGVNIDADERPELIMRKSRWMGGQDVNGTADATLGQYTGKAAAVANMTIGRKYFPEHGTLWIMALPRFPSVTYHEMNYLDKKTNPTYKEIAGDPDILKAEPPITHQVQDFSDSAVTAPIGKHPYGQWYRYNANRVHPRFEGLQGYLFMQTSNDLISSHYISQNYDDAFQTDQLFQWNASMNINIRAERVVPGPLSSIFAGV